MNFQSTLHADGLPSAVIPDSGRSWSGERWQTTLIDAARDTRPVSGLTHNFYRYPARFSPCFVRAAIEAFTSPGDLVLDPFVGGGTTLVEALALGRHSIGIDISTLATFVSEIKTAIFNDEEFSLLESWASNVLSRINMHGQAVHFGEYAEAGYYRHLESASTWRLRKAIEQALSSTLPLPEPHLEAFGRCVVLRTAQWALDSRKVLPKIGEFRQMLAENAADMLAGARALRAAALSAATEPTTVRLIRNATADLLTLPVPEDQKAPKLVLTSPPYPGIHVLYHRWQVDGRKETPAPFWIANRLDGSGSSYYTMGDRKPRALPGYFDRIQAALARVVELCDDETVFVQVVAFSEPEWQLPRYLDAAAAAGLIEMRLPALTGERDGRLWRSVPNRRWHADQLGETHGSQEVVLFHRRAR